MFNLSSPLGVISIFSLAAVLFWIFNHEKSSLNVPKTGSTKDSPALIASLSDSGA